MTLSESIQRKTELYLSAKEPGIRQMLWEELQLLEEMNKAEQGLKIVRKKKAA